MTLLNSISVAIALAALTTSCTGGSSGDAAEFNSNQVSTGSNSEPCQGTTITPPATVLYAPAVPQPETADDIVGIIIQNPEPNATAKRIVTFGQVFISGQVKTTDALVAKTNGITSPIQLDTLATWPDGSVKLASLALELPSLCANSEIRVLIANSAASQNATAINLNTSTPTLTVTLDFTGGGYSGSQTIDLGRALKITLSAQPDYWLRGPLVTQARVDVPLSNGQAASTATLHLTADVSLFADGSAMADVQFNNDLTTVIPKAGSINPQAPLPSLDYTATINFQGKQVSQKVSQVQYTNWHSVLWSTTTPSINVQHDISYLVKTGAILPYDLSTGVNSSLLQSYESTILQKPDFGQPLATNGITTYMPMTGGRPDIGFTTQFNTVWLLTQDSRAAKLAIAQSDTSGAIPWNYKLANGHWLTPEEATDIWVNGRGGPHGYTSGVTNVADNRTWSPDTAHQPNLNFIPALMTASRWHVDRQLAQAASNLSSSWPGSRCKVASCNILLNASDQVRSQAWGFREVMLAAFIGKTGTVEQVYFNRTLSDNWAYLRSQQATWSASQGEAAGWVPGDTRAKGTTAPWSQDFLTVTAAWSAFMGDARASQFIAWQDNWLTGRFTHPDMNPRDGCGYLLVVAEPSTGIPIPTWAGIRSATVASGTSNGEGWSQSQGYYCALARSAVSSASGLFPQNAKLKQALDWINQSGAPYTDQASFRNDPTFNVQFKSANR